MLDLESIAQPSYVHRPGREIPAIGRTEVTTPMATLVWNDHLHGVRQARELITHLRAVEARATVEPDQYRSPPHPVLAEQPLRAAHLEEQPDVAKPPVATRIYSGGCTLGCASAPEWPPTGSIRGRVVTGTPTESMLVMALLP